MKIKLIDSVFCFLFLFLLLFVVAKYKKENENNNNYILKNFDDLKLLHSNTIKEILSIEANKVNNFDLLIKLQKDKKTIFNNQIGLIKGESYSTSIEFINAFNAYKLTNTRMNEEIETYKRVLAITNNSLNYSHYLMEKITASFDNEELYSRSLILQSLFYLFRDIERDELDSVKSKMSFFTSQENRALFASSEQLSLLDDLQMHLNAVVEGRSTINKSLISLLENPYNESIEALYDNLINTFDNKIYVYQIFYFLIVFLMLIASVAIIILIYSSSNLVSRLTQDNVKLDDELRDAAIFYEHCSDGVMICDENKTVISSNPAYTAITGIKAENLIGNMPVVFSPDKLPKTLEKEILTALAVDNKWEGEIYSANADTNKTLKFVSIISLKKDENVERYIVIIRDIEEISRQEKLIYRQANYDPLTNLPNRHCFNVQANSVLINAVEKKIKFAALFIDLDNFKKINDSLGHTIGDELLVVMSERLKGCIKEGDIVSRFGGDEFIILLNNTYDDVVITKVINRVLLALFTPVKSSANVLLHTSGSIGVAVYPNHGSNLSVLISNADTAMYEAKKKGKNNFCIFEERMNVQVQNYLSIESKLINALSNDELYLEYQPIIDPKSQLIYGAEALVRWKHQGDNIPPNEFISIAEESGLIAAIGEWIIKSSCEQLANWNRDIDANLKMSINISPRQFIDKDFNLLLMSIIEQTGANPYNINLEITENVFIEGSNSSVTKVFGELSSKGISISLDDFGTGYSSLSYLKNFPVNNLKIDRSFITNLDHDKHDQHLVKAIISLAKDFGVKVVAEGVESKEHLSQLSYFDCDYIQGYFYSRPLAVKDFENLYKQDIYLGY